ncbi:hypothetical protein DW352_21790 [Pseudolabrys taiwanensis]|uniref:Uncharacterized protein n=2 Tax=Pseudolabrys taiwanensis TaxID=331696 RepID=A0A346A172_9HYPH|nr:hypothetical protein DW352_21790 [Pseudolabrys taiwanensis]
MLGVGLALGLSAGAQAGDVFHYDFAAPYLQRSDKIFAGAGDAKDVNAATHVIDPWPRYVGNRRIPANGERMVGAIERYRDIRRLPLAPQPILPIEISTSGFSSSNANPGGGAGAAASTTTGR